MKSIKDFADITIITEYKRRFESIGETISKAEISAHQARRLLLDPGLAHDREHFGVIFLDGQNKMIKSEVLFSGSITTSAVYPREVIKKILEYEAAHIILCHNHPSGEITPSSSDRAVTKKLQTACDSIDVQILDHIIIGKAEYYSFNDHHLI